MKKVLIVGGGYSGLTCAITLSRHPGFEVVLLSDKTDFFHSIRLHLVPAVNIHELKISFASLASKFNFEFHQLKLGKDKIDEMINTKKLLLDEDQSPVVFDYLILTTGSTDKKIFEAPANCFDLEKLKGINFKSTLEEGIRNIDKPSINVIGGGPTGVQFAFELQCRLHKICNQYQINLITLDTGLTPDFPDSFGSYIHKAAHLKKISIYYQSECMQIYKNKVMIKRFDDSIKILSSDFTLVFPGVKSNPQKFNCNAKGQMLSNNKILKRVFCAGDNSKFEGKGSNQFSAQTAIRKARVVAENIINIENKNPLLDYDYQPLGYFISLGPGDGVGWLLNKNIVTSGLAAYAIKETIEKQFELFLEGFNTYFELGI